ncbi:hypothetical protein [Chryseobacterium sp. Hurlbut01]|nr:hypothetical protein [Chryseobacterium sp. Hurlbut01]
MKFKVLKTNKFSAPQLKKNIENLNISQLGFVQGVEAVQSVADGYILM